MRTMSAPSTKGNKLTGHSQSLTYTAISSINPSPCPHKSSLTPMSPAGLNLGRPTRQPESSSRCSVPSTRTRRLKKTQRFVPTHVSALIVIVLSQLKSRSLSNEFLYISSAQIMRLNKVVQEKKDIYEPFNILPLDAASASQSIMQLEEVCTTHNNVTCFLKTNNCIMYRFDERN